MSLLSQHCQLENSLQIIQFLPFHNPPSHLTSTVLTFFYSLNSKNTRKGRRFQTVENIITNVANDLKVIPRTSFEQTVLPKLEKVVGEVHC
jgi:hypothetical protein